MCVLQSLTAGRRKLNPTSDLSFNPIDIKTRLSGVTVFTVANNETGEFVLASGKASHPQTELQHMLIVLTKRYCSSFAELHLEAAAKMLTCLTAAREFATTTPGDIMLFAERRPGGGTAFGPFLLQRR